MAKISITSFNSGVLTPRLDTRSNVEKYSSGCRILDNMFPTVYGGAERRPGTKYIADSKNEGESVYFVPFIYNSDIAYMCEFGDLYIRFYYDGAILEDGAGDPVEVTTTYTIADVPELHIEQIGDVMRIVHPNYPSATLTRTTATLFALADIAFTKGPFRLRNDLDNDDGITLWCDAVTKDDTGTLTASDDVFENGHVGAIFNLTNKRAGKVSKCTAPGSKYNSVADGAIPYVICAAIDIKGTYRFTTHGTWTAIITLERKEGDSPWETVEIWVSEKDSNIQKPGNELKDNVQYRAVLTEYTSGTIFADITVGDSTQSGVVRIDSVTNSTSAEVTVLSKLTSRTITDISVANPGIVTCADHNLHDGDSIAIFDVVGATDVPDGLYTVGAISDINSFALHDSDDVAVNNTVQGTAGTIAEPTERWAEGAWSNAHSYPMTVATHEGRVLYGGTTTDTGTVWFSAVDDYDNFEEGVNDADSFSIPLLTTNTIRWIRSLDALIVGTSGEEWQITPNKLYTPLTPTNFSPHIQSTIGSNHIQPVRVGEVILFFDYVSRQVREFVYSDERQRFMAPSLTVLAEHITQGGITDAAFQRNPEPTLWCIVNGESLISLNYDREQNVVAWANHTVGGSGAPVSVGIVPSTEEDHVWLAVKRTINGTVVTHIEFMQPRYWGADQEDCFFVDCGITDVGGDVTIDGLDHLEGETVAVLGDGAVLPNEVVNGGQITIDEAVTTAQVGLPYRYQLKPMRLAADTNLGSIRGSSRKIHEVVFSFYKTLNAQFGIDLDHLYDINWRSTEPYDTPPALFTGDKIETFDGGFDPEDPILITGTDPLPCTVLGIVARTEL